MQEEYETFPEAKNLNEFPAYELDSYTYGDWVKIENGNDEYNTEWIKIEERYGISLERLI